MTISGGDYTKRRSVMSSPLERVNRTGILSWDLELLIKGMQVSLAPSEGAGFDVLDQDVGKWEVRSITKGGVYFCPSYMKGSGRKFEEQGFLEKLEAVRGYVLSDVESFPRVPYWMIPTEIVENWWNGNLLGTSTEISRKKALQLIEGI